MRIFSLIAALLLATSIMAKTGNGPATPLSAYSAEWNDARYKQCNTAANTPYLSDKEKEVIYVLNMARMNPRLFCRTVVARAHEISSFIDTSNEVYYKSLVALMSHMEPMGILTPDEQCFVSAQCHAVSTGKTGYVGHDRKTAECRKKQHFYGECCQYGITDPLEIVLSLLVDQNVESLGHRHICLGNYTKMSPAMASHKQYGTITVLDFY